METWSLKHIACMSREEITHAMSLLGEEIITYRHTLRHLQKLLLPKLSGIKAQHQRTIPAGRALRAALQDQAYKQHVVEMISVSAKIRRHRVQLDILKMVFASRFQRTLPQKQP